jgi:hypothetical protein
VISNTASVTTVNQTDTNTSNNSATESTSVSSPPPTANDDSYDALGNVSITVNEANGVILAGGGPGADDDGGSSITVTEVQGNAANVGAATNTDTAGLNGVTGSVTLQADGSFTYEPPPGFVGTDTFSYQITNAGGSDTATVSITTTDMIWFIDNSSGASSNGTLNFPFTSINDLNSSQTGSAPGAQQGDSIFIAAGSGNYTNGITLLTNQTLIGEGVSAPIEVITGLTPPVFSDSLPSTGGTSPSLTTTSGNAINVATNNEIGGLNIGSTGGTGISGSEVGTLFVREVGIPGPSSTRLGGGVDLTSTTGAAIDIVLDRLSTNSSTDEGIRLSGVSGFFDITDTSGTISNTGVSAVDITGAANPNEVALGITFASVSASGGTNGIQISNTTGSFTITGTTDIDNTTSEGINISGSSATFSFATVDIDIANPGADGINLNGLTGSFTINSNGGGVAFDTTVPDDRHSIRIHDSNNVTIKGTAANCTTATKTSCFTITGGGTGGGQSGLGPDNSGFHAVAITDSGDVDLQFINVTDHGGSNSGGADSGVFVVDPDAGSTLNIDDSFFNDVDDDAIEIEKRNMGIFNVNIRDNAFEGTVPAAGAGTHLDAAVHFDDFNLGAIVALIDGNTIDETSTHGLLIRPAGTSGTGVTKNSFTITDNIIRDSDNNAIAIDSLDSSMTDAIIKGNTLTGEQNVTGIGDDEAIDICNCGSNNTSTLNVTIGGPNLADRNTINNWGDDAIRIDGFGSNHAGTINALVQNNDIDNTVDECVRVRPDDLQTFNARIIDNDCASTTQGFTIDPSTNTAALVRAFFSGNEGPEYHFDDQANATYELGCNSANATCNANIGGTLTLPGANATVTTILSDDGNTTSGGAPNVTSDAGGPALDIVNQATIPLP